MDCNTMNGNSAWNPVPAVQEKKGLCGSTLKLIAVVAMFIDHLGAAVLARVLMYGRMVTLNGGNAVTQWLLENEHLYTIYMVMRFIGRIAFPIYCFLMIQGFEHTRDRRKYAFRLGLFAIISEIPFDLAFSGKILEFGYQNVFFTLFIGFLTMWACNTVAQKAEWGKVPKALLSILIVAAGMIIAKLLKTDYDAIGVFCIMVLFFARKNKVQQIVAGCLAFCWELTAPLAFIPIGFYNGKRGWKMKYFFYIFYPAHLLLLYVICYFMGLSQFSAI